MHLISFQSDKHLEFRRQLNNINLNVIPIQSKLLLASTKKFYILCKGKKMIVKIEGLAYREKFYQLEMQQHEQFYKEQ